MIILKSGSAILAGSDLLGTNHALSLVFSGYATSAVALVAAALFLAAAMQETNLDKTCFKCYQLLVINGEI